MPDLDLSTIFKAVTQQLSSQKTALNEADTYNHDHGDHMVQIFDLVQKAVSKKSDAPVHDQLAYASEVVEKKASSGSARLYAQGLANAASQFSGKELNATTISTLVQSLMNVQAPPERAEPEQNGGILGSLLSSFTGAGKDANENADDKLDMNDLLRAGLAFYQSRQEGDSNTEAVLDALMAASPMGKSPDRSQSGSLVASTIMKFAQTFKK